MIQQPRLHLPQTVRHYPKSSSRGGDSHMSLMMRRLALMIVVLVVAVSVYIVVEQDHSKKRGSGVSERESGRGGVKGGRRGGGSWVGETGWRRGWGEKLKGKRKDQDDVGGLEDANTAVEDADGPEISSDDEVFFTKKKRNLKKKVEDMQFSMEDQDRDIRNHNHNHNRISEEDQDQDKQKNGHEHDTQGLSTLEQQLTEEFHYHHKPPQPKHQSQQQGQRHHYQDDREDSPVAFRSAPKSNHPHHRTHDEANDEIIDDLDTADQYEIHTDKDNGGFVHTLYAYDAGKAYKFKQGVSAMQSSDVLDDPRNEKLQKGQQKDKLEKLEAYPAQTLHNPNHPSLKPKVPFPPYNQEEDLDPGRKLNLYPKLVLKSLPPPASDYKPDKYSDIRIASIVANLADALHLSSIVDLGCSSNYRWVKYLLLNYNQDPKRKAQSQSLEYLCTEMNVHFRGALEEYFSGVEGFSLDTIPTPYPVITYAEAGDGAGGGGSSSFSSSSSSSEDEAAAMVAAAAAAAAAPIGQGEEKEIHWLTPEYRWPCKDLVIAPNLLVDAESHHYLKGLMRIRAAQGCAYLLTEIPALKEKLGYGTKSEESGSGGGGGGGYDEKEEGGDEEDDDTIVVDDQGKGKRKDKGKGRKSSASSPSPSQDNINVQEIEAAVEEAQMIAKSHQSKKRPNTHNSFKSSQTASRKWVTSMRKRKGWDYAQLKQHGEPQRYLLNFVGPDKERFHYVLYEF